MAGVVNPDSAAAAPASAESDGSAEMAAALGKGIVPCTRLGDVLIPPRERILGDWFMEGDLGFIFGVRGLGKTFLALAMAIAIASGRKCGPWAPGNPQKVIYVDGEMPSQSLGERIMGMEGVENLSVLNHEVLFCETGQVLNLTDPITQQALTSKILENGVKVLILDNLSCLFSGLKENEADSWERVLPWLLTLRRHRVAVVVVHHAGRNGAMRGTSRREDAAFWVIRLDSVEGEERNGARFLSRFVKDRNSRAEQPATEWRFTTDDDARVTITIREASSMQVFLQWIRDGLDTAEDIAREMGVSKGTVSKWARKAMEAGQLRKEKRRYVLVD